MLWRHKLTALFSTVTTSNSSGMIECSISMLLSPEYFLILLLNKVSCGRRKTEPQPGLLHFLCLKSIDALNFSSNRFYGHTFPFNISSDSLVMFCFWITMESYKSRMPGRPIVLDDRCQSLRERPRLTTQVIHPGIQYVH